MVVDALGESEVLASLGAGSEQGEHLVRGRVGRVGGSDQGIEAAFFDWDRIKGRGRGRAGAGAVSGAEAGSVVAIRLTRLHWYDRGCLQVPFLFVCASFSLVGGA